MKKHIPNTITLLNLFMGCVAIAALFQNNLELVFISFVICLLADFMDGFIARKLKVSSNIGKDLDSLSDMVSFGVLPAFIAYHLLEGSQISPYFAFIIAVASAYRLAIFNNSTEQSYSFKGVPTPANALFWMGVLVIQFYEPIIIQKCNFNNENFQILVLIFVFLSAFWLNMPYNIIALKFKNYTFRGNETKYLLIILSIISLVFLGRYSIVAIFALYLMLSMVDNAKIFKHQ